MLDLNKLYEDDYNEAVIADEGTPNQDTTQSRLPVYDYNFNMDEYKEQSAPLIEYLSKNYKKPEPELTPEQAKKAKFAASITDSLSTLAQMYTAGRGAHTRLNNSPGSTNVTQQRLDKLRDDYMKRQMIYENQLAGVNQTAINMFNKEQQNKYDRNYQAQLAEYNRNIANEDYNRQLKEKEDSDIRLIDHRYKAMGDLESMKIEGREGLERLKAGLKPIKSAGGRVSTNRTSSGYTIVKDGQTYNIPPGQWGMFVNSMYGKLKDNYNIGDNAYLQNSAQIKQYIESSIEDIPLEVWNSALQTIGASPTQGQTNQVTKPLSTQHKQNTSGGTSRASKTSSSGGTSRAR